MSGTLSDAYGGGIKSVQRGQTSVSTTNVDVTITSVNTSKSFISQGVTSTGSTAYGGTYIAITNAAYLLNATTVRVMGNGNSGSSATVCWEVVEYY